MEKAIIGKKIGMTQIFDEAGHAVPVTVIEPAPAPWCRRRLPRRTAMRPFSWDSRPSPSASSPSPSRPPEEGRHHRVPEGAEGVALKDSEKYNVGRQSHR